MTKCWLHLTNGWTVSISAVDTPPALCSVAAWPSRKDKTPNLPAVDYFDFDDRIDQRCFTLEDVRKALAKVEASEPPICSCGGSGTVKDENWEQPYSDVIAARVLGDGLIECGFCHGTGRS